MTMRAATLALLFASKAAGLEESLATNSDADHLQKPLKAEAAEKTETKPDSAERSASASWYRHRHPPPTNQAAAYPKPWPVWLLTESGQSNDSPNCGCPDDYWWGQVCTCIIFCNCPNNDCGGGDDGYNNCKGGLDKIVQRQGWLQADGSGGSTCYTEWVYEDSGFLQNYNWFYFFVPGIVSGKVPWDASRVRIALNGAMWPEDPGEGSQFGAYCTGLPCGGFHYSAMNGDGNGWQLDGYYYVRSYRVDTAFEDYGSGDDTRNIAVKVVLFPQWSMNPYDEISCTDWNQDGSPWNYDVGDDFAYNNCVSGDCDSLIPRCGSAIDRLYCMSVDKVWGDGEKDDLEIGGYDFADSIYILGRSFPMLSAFADRYTDTLIPGVGDGAGNMCNPGNPNIYPNEGNCVLTRFYTVNCHEASWPVVSGGAQADGASPFVLGCGTTVFGEARCGNDAGQYWGSFFNSVQWDGSDWVRWNEEIKCVWTRVVDQNDFDCNFRIG